MEQLKGVQDNYSKLMGHNVFDEQGRIKKGKKILKIISKSINKDLSKVRVLDYGCSTGIIDFVIAKKVSRLDGYDIDIAAVEFAKSYCKDLSNISFTTDQMYLSGNRYDVIICNQIYEHVEDQNQMVEDLNMYLETDGIVYFGATNKYIIIEPHYKLPFLSWLPKLEP